MNLRGLTHTNTSWLSKILTVAVLIFASPVWSEAQQCAAVFREQPALNRMSADWENSSILRQRMAQIIEHQNQLRREQNIPLLDSRISQVPTQDNPVARVALADGYPEEQVIGEFEIRGNSARRTYYNDNYSLNYVYEFSGSRLVRAKSYTSTLVDRPVSNTILTRSMSRQEFEKWVNHSFEELGSNNWGFGEPVVHFSDNPSFTSSGGDYLLSVRILQPALVRLQRENSLWTGSIHSERNISEYVIPSRVLRELYDRGELELVPTQEAGSVMRTRKSSLRQRILKTLGARPLYHGTSMFRLQQILRTGYLDSSQGSELNRGTIQRSQGRTLGTTDLSIANRYARASATGGYQNGDPVSAPVIIRYFSLFGTEDLSAMSHMAETFRRTRRPVPLKDLEVSFDNGATWVRLAGNR